MNSFAYTYRSRKSSRWYSRLVRFPAFLLTGWVFLFFVCPLPAQGQPSSVINDFPAVSGVAILDSSGRIQTVFPIPTGPSDVEILPDRLEIAVTTLSGEFLIYNELGVPIFNTIFEPLNDVDCVNGDPNQFLLTSRSGNRIFFYNRSTGEQRNVPSAFLGPVDADLLANGNLLVCDAAAGKVIEITPSGESVWSYENELKQPMDALRLPGGETLIADFDNHRVLIVSANGTVLSDLRGFDHPSKMTLLQNGSVLVADADQQEIEEIFSLTEHRVIRGKMNCIQSVLYYPEQKNYLCAILQKFSPPQEPQEKSPAGIVVPKTGLTLLSFVQNRYVLWMLAIILWIAGIRMRTGSWFARGLMLAAYLILFGLLYVFQIRAAATPDHRPDLIFWLGAFTLSLWVYRDADASYWPRNLARDLTAIEPLPLTGWQWIFGILAPFVSLFSQYYYLQATPFGWRFPWYVPMMVWGMTLYGFFHVLTRNRPRKIKEHSAFQFGPVTVAVPFTTGSVSLEEIDETPGDSDSGDLEHRLIEPWANTIFVLILILGAALYLIGATSVPTAVHGDEAEVALCGIQVRDSGNWNFFDLGWYQIPHLFYLIPAWTMWLFGDNLFGVRVAGALTGIACIPVFYLLARRILRPAPAVIAVFLFAASTFFVHFSRIGIGYNQTTLLTLAVVYGFVRGLQDKDARWLSVAGAFCAIGSLSYQATKILTPLIVSSLFLLWVTRSLPLRTLARGMAAFSLAYWVGFAPLGAVYLYDTNAAFSRTKSVTLFSPQGEELVRRSYPPNIPYKELMKIQIERSLLAPVSFHDNSPYLSNPIYGGMLDNIPAIFFVAGVFVLAIAIRRPVSRLLLFWIVCILLVGSAMTDHAPSYQRLVGLIPFLALTAAPILNGCLAQVTRVCRWMPRTRLHATTAVLAFLLIMGMHRYFHQIMSKPQLLDDWTRIAEYLRDAGPTQYTYFFGVPHFFFQYGTVRFMAPDARGEDVLQPEQFLKNRVSTPRGPVCFFLIRDNRRYINDLRRLYPGGREENHFNREGGAPFTTYVVNL